MLKMQYLLIWKAQILNINDKLMNFKRISSINFQLIYVSKELIIMKNICILLISKKMSKFKTRLNIQQ